MSTTFTYDELMTMTLALDYHKFEQEQKLETFRRFLADGDREAASHIDFAEKQIALINSSLDKLVCLRREVFMGNF